MANRSITQLQVATALTGLEPFPLVQNGITKQALTADLAALATPTITNDITTATAQYPLFADATSGKLLTVYTSDPQFLYTPLTGTLEARVLQADNGIVVNSNTINSSYTLLSGDNGMSAGPMTIPGGVTVTVQPNAVWQVVGAPSSSTAPWSFNYGINKLTVQYNGGAIASVDSAGNVVALSSFAAPGTP